MGRELTYHYAVVQTGPDWLGRTAVGTGGVALRDVGEEGGFWELSVESTRCRLTQVSNPLLCLSGGLCLHVEGGFGA